MKPLTYCAVFPAAALLAACASPGGLAPKSETIAPASLAASRSLGDAQLSQEWPAADWWKRFGDPQLDALVDEALSGNPSMGAARARLDRAAAFAGAAGAPLTPQMSASADLNRQRYSATGIFPAPIGGSYYTQGQIALQFNYEIDFWGKNRAAYDAALGQARAAEVDAFAARLLLSAAVAHAYAQLGHAFEQLDVAQATLEQRQAIYDLTRQRLAAGLDTKVELKQAEASIPAARQRIAQLEEEIALARHQLAALAGKGPDRGLAIERPRAEARPVALPSALPADLIGRRPDVVAQRRRFREGAVLPERQPRRAHRRADGELRQAAVVGQQDPAGRRGAAAADLRRRTAARQPRRDGRRLRPRRGAVQPDRARRRPRSRRPAHVAALGRHAERRGRTRPERGRGSLFRRGRALSRGPRQLPASARRRDPGARPEKPSRRSALPRARPFHRPDTRPRRGLRRSDPRQAGVLTRNSTRIHHEQDSTHRRRERAPQASPLRGDRRVRHRGHRLRRLVARVGPLPRIDRRRLRRRQPGAGDPTGRRHRARDPRGRHRLRHRRADAGRARQGRLARRARPGRSPARQDRALGAQSPRDRFAAPGERRAAPRRAHQGARGPGAPQ